MAKDRQIFNADGQEVQQADLTTVFTEAALADDVVLAELLRVAPFDGTAAKKLIVPYRVTGQSGAMVQPNGASGSVKLLPFRAVVGSRTSISATPGSALANWSDIRSAVYAPTDDNSTLGHGVAFAANASGNPRWDLVYVEFDVDQNGPTVSRGVRAPGVPLTTPPVATPMPVTKVQTLTVNVVTGTPGASPSPPALPNDTQGATGRFYIPIAAVLIPNGFSGVSTVGANQIHMLAPIVPLSTAFGGVDERPATAISVELATAKLQAWGAGGGSARPNGYMPATARGRHRIRFPFDATGSGLLTTGAIVDDSIDWRKRTFRTEAVAFATGAWFPWQPGATAGSTNPVAGGNAIVSTQYGQSFLDDSLSVVGVTLPGGMVFYANHTTLSTIASGSNAIGLYVDLATGALKLFISGTPGCLIDFTIEASAPYDNA